ncbi:MAG: hypothetical protein HY791_08250 [Deltaproteobacteria bacterium]|nr:hypothetical protein [Deltaproteobacteria bacterium]
MACGEPSPPEITVDAWSQVVARISADGDVDKDTALVAFALAIGPLPGVIVPEGEPGLPASGSGPVRWLVRYWDELEPGHRAAAEAYLIPPAPQGLASTSTVTGPDPWRQLAEKMAGLVAANLGTAGHLPIRIVLNDHEVQIGGRVVLAYAIPRDSNGQVIGVAASCTIFVNPGGKSPALEGERAMLLGHETFHCAQSQLAADLGAWARAKPWVVEGMAQWVGDTLGSPTKLNFGQWNNYLSQPEVPLFSREYSALGFYAHMAESGLSVWKAASLMSPVAADNQKALLAAVPTAEGQTFFDSWASGFFREASLGPAWDTAGPSIPSREQVLKQPDAIVIGGPGTQGLAVPSAANRIYKITASAELIRVQITQGFGRLKEEGGPFETTRLGDGVLLCTRADHECKCPSGQPVPGAIPASGNLRFGLSGARSGGAAVIAGLDASDLDLLCAADPPVHNLELHVPWNADQGPFLDLHSCTGPLGPWIGEAHWASATSLIEFDSELDVRFELDATTKRGRFEGQVTQPDVQTATGPATVTWTLRFDATLADADSGKPAGLVITGTEDVSLDTHDGIHPPSVLKDVSLDPVFLGRVWPFEDTLQAICN